MSPEQLIGRIVTFFPSTGAVIRCQRLPDRPRYAGTITAATPAPPLQPGNVPDMTLTIQGRTGKTATVSLTENYVSLFDKWEDATKDT